MGHIKFATLLQEILLAEVSLEQLKKQFVDSGKLTQEVFDEIVNAASGKSAYATWLAARVEAKDIKEEDIYKFEDYLKTFERYKKAYPKHDIFAYKTARDIQEFISKTVEIRDMRGKDSEEGGEVADTADLLSPTQVQSLAGVGIKLIGVCEGYQCFEVPTSCRGNKEAYTRYKNLIGQCSGGKIDICTIANQSHFDNYLKDGPYYIFFNLSDSQSPYQFHYESNQFMDRQDRSVF